MDYISVKELAEKWKLSERWIQKLCEDGRIDGVQRFGRSWMIPKEAEKPGNLQKGRPSRKIKMHSKKEGGGQDV